jgi:hypothetical protein
MKISIINTITPPLKIGMHKDKYLFCIDNTYLRENAKKIDKIY